MRKVIKNVVKSTVAAISTLLVLLITLPLLAALLINISAVQNFVVKKVMANLSEKLGTTVSIDRVHIKLINRVVVDGFYVEDYQGDTLLYVGRLTAPIVDLGLMGEPVTFGKVTLEGTEMWLRRDSTDTMNIKHIVNTIRGDREKNPDDNTRIKIMGIEADSLTFGLLRYDKPFRDGLDFSRFIIRNTSVRIDDFSIIRDTIRIDIRSLSCDERSGFRVDDISAHDLVIAPGAVFLDDARIKSPGADLFLPSIRLKGDDWLAFVNFIDSVSVGVKMRDSHLTSGFVGWFLPEVGDWDVTLDGLSLNTSGPVSSIAGEIEKGQTLSTTFSLGFESRGIPDFDHVWFDADVHSVNTSGGDIDSLVRNVTGKGIPESILKPLGRLEQIDLSGRFTGGLNDFAAEGTLLTDAGEIEASASVRAGDFAGNLIDGRVIIPRFDLGRIFDSRELGSVTGKLSMNGVLEKGAHMEGALESTVDALQFRDYTYRGITIEGSLDDKMFDGNVHSTDRNLAFDFSGMLDFNDSIPKYNFELDLQKADLAITNLNRTDSVSQLSGRLTASASGSSLDDLNGRIEVRDPIYISSSDTVRTGLITLAGRNSQTSKLITLHSDFADAEFRSRISYRDMFDYLGDFLRDYVPLLYTGEGPAAPLPPAGRNVGDAANYSVLHLTVKNTDRLLGAVLPGAQIARGSEVSFLFNPFIRSFSLSAHSDFIEYKNTLALKIDLNSDNKTDSLTLHLSSEDFYSGTLHIPDLAVHGGAKGRQMNLSTRLEDPDESFSALLGLRIDSGTEQDDRSVRFRFSPSYIALQDQIWYVTARSIVYGNSRVFVDNFRVYSEGNDIEELTVDGVISKNPKDSLHVRLNRFDLSPLGRLTEGRGYRIGGRASGYIDFMSLLAGTRMNAGIEFRGLSLNGAVAAPLRFTSFWDSAGQRVRFQMLNHRNNVNVLHGSFSPARGVIDAVAQIDSLDVGLLDPLLVNVLENTKGSGNFHVTLGGTFRSLEMNGKVEIPHFETTVQFTQASYSLDNIVIDVNNSRLNLPMSTVKDAYGNTGSFGMTVYMSNLRNIGVDINATVNNILAFDTGPEANEAFYGKVFASGSLGISVDNMGTRMGIAATTGRGTKFHLPLNAKSNISWADFVRFRDPFDIDTANVLARKKLIYERKLQGNNRARSKKPFDLDMTVDLTPDAEFNMVIDPSLGNGISAHGRGIINMRVNPATNLFSMVGDCTISEGRFGFSMADVFNKDFVITPGSTLVWTGEPEDALLNIEAVYRTRASLVPLTGDAGGSISNRPVPVECIIRLTERLSQPEITFDIRLPAAGSEEQLLAENAMSTQELKSTQFLSLLLIGSFSPGNSYGGQSAGAATTGAVGFDILTSQLSNFLSTEDYNIYFKYRPAQDISGGNYTGNQYDIGFSKGFIDNRLLLEIEGNYVEDRGANSIRGSDLSGDVYLTWVIDRAGNLKLKAFTQTIDRWDENQGLQENGIGIYYKKDFDSIRDIWRRNSDTFTNFGDTDTADSTSVVHKSRRELRRQRKKAAGTGTGVGEGADVSASAEEGNKDNEI